MRWLLPVALLVGCSFPTDGVQVQGDPPDAEIAAPDACAPVDELCNGIDDDCDGNPDEGFASNTPCDGPDADLCIDDVMVCDTGGGEVCSDGDDDIELCNAADDDCDTMMDEGFVVEADCDGTDGDMCNEGKTQCTSDGAGTECTDVSDTIVETCNDFDDDCDSKSDETFDKTMDLENCGTCGTMCTNAHGTTSCQPPGTCTPVCTNGSAQCDGSVINGCELQDTNPVCTGAPLTPDISINGDAGTPVVVVMDNKERALRIHIIESAMGTTGSTIPITANIALTSGAGATYHLTVFCPACGTAVAGINDVVGVGRADGNGDRSYDVFALVTYDSTVPSTTCAQWTLTVTGNSGSLNRCGGT